MLCRLLSRQFRVTQPPLLRSSVFEFRCINFSSNAEYRNNNPGIFTRAREMAKTHAVPYFATYSALTTVSIAALFASLHYHYVDSSSLHAAIVQAIEFAEQYIGPNESFSTMKASPELGVSGNLALALVADSCLGPLKLMIVVPVVAKYTAAQQK